MDIKHHIFRLTITCLFRERLAWGRIALTKKKTKQKTNKKRVVGSVSHSWPESRWNAGVNVVDSVQFGSLSGTWNFHSWHNYPAFPAWAAITHWLAPLMPVISEAAGINTRLWIFDFSLDLLWPAGKQLMRKWAAVESSAEAASSGPRLFRITRQVVH